MENSALASEETTFLIDRSTQSHLLISTDDQDESRRHASCEHHHHKSGHSTVPESALNIAKTCLGTGTLALPFAASQGGYVFSTVGLAAISGWNLYCVDRMVKCKNLLPASIISSKQGSNSEKKEGSNDVLDNNHNTSVEQALHHCWSRTSDEHRSYHQDSSSSNACTGQRSSLRYVSGTLALTLDDPIEVEMPEGTATFGKVVWHAIGPSGLHLFDIIMIILLLGIIIAYEVAILGFVARTPLTMGSDRINAIVISVALIPLSCVPNVGFLSHFSAFGIGAICLTFFIIFCYGARELATNISSDTIDLRYAITESLWPDDVTGVANWFGVAVFSFGIVPITYNIQESMAKPNLMVRATDLALRGVFIIYATISNVVAILFTTTPHGFQGDVLEHLPTGKGTWIAMFTRLAMSAMVLVSAPLIILPCSELIEGKLGISAGMNHIWRVLIRICIIGFTTLTSVAVPGFVFVISLIGSCFVSLVSFVFPPLFFIRLRNKMAQKSNVINDRDSHSRIEESLVCDYVMLVIGILCMTIASCLTIANECHSTKLKETNT